MKSVKQSILCLIIAAALAGCVSNLEREHSFSPEWADRVKSERAFEARKKRMHAGEEMVLMGEQGKRRASIYMDEKGRPKLNVGQPKGLSADLDYDNGPEVEVKYKLNWNFAKPKKQK